MAYFRDLGRCRYFRHPASKKLLAVGWLEPGHRFTTGKLERSVLRALVRLLEEPWQPGGGFRGFHDCEFCPAPDVPMEFRFDDRVVRLGAKNLFVPGAACIYVAPSLIAHYIVDHDYCPPTEFQHAVTTCPPMRSNDYFQAVASVAPPWVRTLALAALQA
jgi:hypothetical protein